MIQCCFCFAYLPIPLASRALSCVLSGFGPFHVVLGVLNFSGVYFVLGPTAVWVLSGLRGFAPHTPEDNREN